MTLSSMKKMILVALVMVITGPVLAQQTSDSTIKKNVEIYKNDVRGPYKDLRWFCPDGSLIPPRERCPQKGGKQRARYKDEIITLQNTRHIFLGQILTTTDYADFWDVPNNNSRLKQYQLEKYLRGVDNGWILRQAQFYRGAVQAEDEEDWGVGFFNRLLADANALEEHFFLIRQALKDIPHQGDDNQAQRIRSLSQTIAEMVPAFMDLRVKIHGQPQPSDIESVKGFIRQNTSHLSPEATKQLDELLAAMRNFYRPFDEQALKKHMEKLSASTVKESLAGFLEMQEAGPTARQKITAVASIILDIRKKIKSEEKASGRLALLDISNMLEEMIYKESANWEPATLSALLEKNYRLSQTAAGAGFIELWEWQQVGNHLVPPAGTEIDLAALNLYLQLARSQVEWGTGTVKATYQNTLNLFAGFEPLANGFIDDRIRSSVLLPLGKTVSSLGDFIATQSGLNNKMMGIANQSSIRGLNPGFAFGELVVVSGSPDKVEFSGDKIYVFDRAPADLKPVAGIATVLEGNLVSHVQLLARNLGIPNAVLSGSNLEDLKLFDGKTVFYAVSNKGTVIMKPAEKMGPEERTLFTVKKKNDDKIRVPVDKIRLDQTSVLNLRDINASDSGKLSGPKAANLGQLKHFFPDKVVEGLVLPFGIFRRHMDQRMPGRSLTYWQFLNDMFATANKMRANGIAESEVETYQLSKLETLREAIKTMPLLPVFKTELERKFRDILGSPMGTLPVFIRSDTNMEDLKDFTGAGLNLTLFNVADKDKIIQGIKDVWASPYTERSFRWRQTYLLNPENVFPSILIIPSVDVDYSGVLITKGVRSGNPDDLTIAFSRGAGGAVDGQVAESYLIKPSGETMLIAPSREPFYTTMPVTGNTLKKATAFNNPILNEKNIQAIQELSSTVKKVFPATPGIAMDGPYDIELGFKDDKLWLFQVRPFVENKKALNSAYLDSISPRIDESKKIKLNSKL